MFFEHNSVRCGYRFNRVISYGTVERPPYLVVEKLVVPWVCTETVTYKKTYMMHGSGVTYFDSGCCSLFVYVLRYELYYGWCTYHNRQFQYGPHRSTIPRSAAYQPGQAAAHGTPVIWIPTLFHDAVQILVFHNATRCAPVRCRMMRNF